MRIHLTMILGLAALLFPVYSQDISYNPDPGATYRKPAPEFYQPPPGTPPDYGARRDPILETPHDPLIDLHEVRKDWQNRDYTPEKLPSGTMAIPDRWAMAIPAWMRYNTPQQETPYQYPNTNIWDPYKQSLLKGDKPVIGQDIFFSMTAASFTSVEARDVPTPSGVSTASANSSEFYGQGDQQEIDQFLSLSLDLFKGETVFQPVTWMIHFEPVYNINYSRVKETNVLSVNPAGSNSQAENSGTSLTNSNGSGSGGGLGNPVVSSPGFDPGGLLPGDPGFLLGSGGNPATSPTQGTSGNFNKVGPTRFGSSYVTRTKDFVSLQEAFVEFHIADFTDNYDFMSIRGGNQPFNSDFRGFVFNDTNLGLRLFGNMDSNRWQYNVAAFDMREKDTYSELNTLDSRNQYVFVANVYRQDFFAKGYTAQLSFLTNLDEADIHYNRTGVIMRPAPIGGPIVPHDVRSYYLGWNGDGHIDKFNITHSFYEVLGRDSANGLAGKAVDINAQMAAVELSYDRDWIRFKGSFFYASGDKNPTDSHGTAFDSIVDTPNFIGGPFSYYARQGFVLANSSVNFKQGQSLLPDLRTSKTEGQSNFVNPGVLIYGVGTDMDLLPTLKLFLNGNYIQMVDVEPINLALQTANTKPEIGWDLSMGVKYRPLLTNNIIISAGLGALIPGDGYKAIYRTNTVPVPGYDSSGPAGHVDEFLYSGFGSVTFTY